jgi:hypothetical protein
MPLKHVIALSGGKDSTAMALRLREVEPHDYTYLTILVGNELPEHFEHLANLEKLLQTKLTYIHPYGPGDNLEYLIHTMKHIPSQRSRWCTRLLKIAPTKLYLMHLGAAIQYVGLRADEPQRPGLYDLPPRIHQRWPLREWGWSADDCWDYLKDHDVKIPKRTDCAWCWGQRLAEWKQLLDEHPDIYERAVVIEDTYHHTFRSPARDTWPAPLKLLRDAFRSGRPLRGEHCSDRCRVCRL